MAKQKKNKTVQAAPTPAGVPTNVPLPAQNTASNTAAEEDEVNKTPAQILAERAAAERAAAAEYDKEQKAIEAEHNARAAAEPAAASKEAPAADKWTLSTNPRVVADAKQNSLWGGLSTKELYDAYNRVNGMSRDEQNKLREEYAKGNNSKPDYFIANALLNNADVTIQAAGDTSNTKVAKNVVENKKSGNTNVVKPEEPKEEPKAEQPAEKIEAEPVAYNPNREELADLISKRDRKSNGINYPSVYTAYKNGLFGDPDDPDAKRTYGAFLADHIIKSLGNRSTFHAVGNRVDETKAEDVGGQQSLFDEKIKKDWTSQIDRYNKQQDDILAAKTNVIADNITKLGGIQNNQDAIDFALSLKTRDPQEIQKLINIATSEAALNGQATPEMLALAKNPNQLADLFVAMEKAKVSQAQLGNIAAGLSNQLAGLNLDTAKKTQAANILNTYIGTASNALGAVGNAVKAVGGLQ